MPEPSILLVEDDATQRRMVGDILRGAGYAVTGVASVDDALAAFETRRPDLVLSDWRIGADGDGLELMRRLRARDASTAFLLTTAYGTIAHAVEAVQKGVDDYLPKPFDRASLLLAVERTLRTRALAAENRRLAQQLGERDRLLELLGRAPAMQVVYRQLERVAATDATVLVTGESGTGKELAARALHQLSPRRSGPFVAVNCAAVPAELLEAEFFGTRRGAFTGAHQDREGRFVAASAGTLFLDEIGELPLPLQPKLLRALQERRVAPLGGDGEIAVDARIVAATNRDLRTEVAAGRIREDLYYRLAVMTIELPPLRERRDDLPLLIDHFVAHSARTHGVAPPLLSATLRRRLLDHGWPGNVRELANTIERLVILAQDGAAATSDLPPSFRDASTAAPAGFTLPPAGLQWEQLEQSLLRQALVRANGNRKRAAELLGLSYKAFLYRLEKFGVAVPPPGE